MVSFRGCRALILWQPAMFTATAAAATATTIDLLKYEVYGYY